jgi:ferredoxin-NADP reductase
MKKMPIHKIKLLAKREIAKDTLLFIFEKPEGLTFAPGQYAGFTLIDPSETDANGITRRFSLLSSPDDKEIMIATRIQNSAFKRVLNKLSMGSEIKFAGPTGNFTLHEDTTIPAVFIAGGIGIVPFYSMIKHATHHHLSRELFLFYGNQSRQDAALLPELNLLQQQNSHLKLIPTLALPDATWSGETGYITHTMIKKQIQNLAIPLYYICGSPVMVTTLQETLVEMGIAEERIRIEDFPGY